MKRYLWLWLILIVSLVFGAAAWAFPAGAALSFPDVRENLHYQVSLGVWGEITRVSLLLKETAPGRYLAEFNGAPRGMGKLVSQWLPEHYETEMIVDNGWLKPLVYREVFQANGEQVKKEYRFNYRRHVLEIWRNSGVKPLTKRYEIPFTGPMYDPLSLFYNLRLGNLGPLTSGTTLKVTAVPTPEPQEMILRLGPESEMGRKIMMTWGPPGAATTPCFIYLDKAGVPTSAYSRVGVLGKLSGELVNPGDIVKEGLLRPVPLPLADLKVKHRNNQGRP